MLDFEKKTVKNLKPLLKNDFLVYLDCYSKKIFKNLIKNATEEKFNVIEFSVDNFNSDFSNSPNGIDRDEYSLAMRKLRLKNAGEHLINAFTKDLFPILKDLFNISVSLENTITDMMPDKTFTEVYEVADYLVNKTSVPILITISDFDNFDRKTKLILGCLVAMLKRKNGKYSVLVRNVTGGVVSNFHLEKLFPGKDVRTIAMSEPSLDDINLLKKDDNSNHIFFGDIISILGDSSEREAYFQEFKIEIDENDLKRSLIYLLRFSPIKLSAEEIARILDNTNVFKILKILNEFVRRGFAVTEHGTYSDKYYVSNFILSELETIGNEEIEAFYLERIQYVLESKNINDNYRLAVLSNTNARYRQVFSYSITAMADYFIRQAECDIAKISQMIDDTPFDKYHEVFNVWKDALFFYTSGMYEDAKTLILGMNPETLLTDNSLISKDTTREIYLLILNIFFRTQEDIDCQKHFLDSLNINFSKIENDPINLVKLRLAEKDMMLSDDADRIKKFLMIKSAYEHRISQSSITTVGQWNIAYAIFLSHINSMDWEKVKIAKKSEFFEQSLYILNKYQKRFPELYARVANNVAGDYLWRSNKRLYEGIKLLNGILVANTENISEIVLTQTKINYLMSQVLINDSKAVISCLSSLQGNLNIINLLTEPKIAMLNVHIASTVYKDENLSDLIKYCKSNVNDKAAFTKYCMLTNLEVCALCQQNFGQAKKYSAEIDQVIGEVTDVSNILISQREAKINEMIRDRLSPLPDQNELSKKQTEIQTGYTSKVYFKLFFMSDIENWNE